MYANVFNVAHFNKTFQRQAPAWCLYHLNIVGKHAYLEVSSLSANPSLQFPVMQLIVETTIEMSDTHARHSLF